MRRWLSGLLVSAATVAAVSGLVALLEPHVPVLSLLVLYILVVLPVAAVWGTVLAAFTSVLSVVVFAYLFLAPIHTVRVGESQNVVALGVFLATAVVAGELAARSRREALESAHLSEEQSALRRVATLVAQQHLVSLALRLRGAAAAIPPDLNEVRQELAGVGAELDEVLEELRELSRGIHPANLTEGGLGPALRNLARRSSVPVQLQVEVEGRLPERVEVTAYYLVSKALTNVAKHANASAVRVDVDAEDGLVRLDIRDDGVGGADPSRGSGLIGLKDRVAATGGTLRVESRPGQGTSLLAELPIDGDQPQAPS